MQKADVLGLQFTDVYSTTKDLTKDENSYHKKHGSEAARKSMNALPSLRRAEFKCPRCSEVSPVMEFTGTLSCAKYPKCGEVFSTINAREGNLLPLNIYLTSLIR